ncbi:MAG: hypothetical protein ACRDOI_09720 [Trebonia sp.]
MAETLAETIEALERQIDELRVTVREAVLAGDPALASVRRAELKRTEQAWEDALSAAAARAAPAAEPAQAPGAPGPPEPPGPSGSLLPLREQVYEALTLLQVPAAPKLIATVHEAFFGSTFPTTRVTSLKRDEERSFRTAPFARPYYICAALSADYLSPSRGLLAVSTWPMERRVIGPLSPRVDFLTAAIRVAEAIERIPTPPLTARRLLQRFAASIPGASGEIRDQVRPDVVRQAAEAELSVHADADSRMRKGAADRARGQLADAEQLYGARLQPVSDETGADAGLGRAGESLR